MTFAYESDYEKLSVYDEITIENAVEQVNAGEIITLKNLTKGYEFECKLTLTARQKTFILAGGVLNSIKK